MEGYYGVRSDPSLLWGVKRTPSSSFRSAQAGYVRSSGASREGVHSSGVMSARADPSRELYAWAGSCPLERTLPEFWFRDFLISSFHLLLTLLQTSSFIKPVRMSLLAPHITIQSWLIPFPTINSLNQLNIHCIKITKLSRNRFLWISQWMYHMQFQLSLYLHLN